MKSPLLNVFPAQAGIPSRLFDAFCSHFLRSIFGKNFIPHQNTACAFPASAGMTNRIIIFTPIDFDKAETIVQRHSKSFAPLLLCAKPFSRLSFFLKKKKQKIQGSIKKAKIFNLPLQRTMLRSATYQLSAIASLISIYSYTCSLLNTSS